jgi:2-dehydropantoate 2-reductase
MKIVVVGVGAMGSLFAGYLARVQEELWVYDVWKEHIDAIRRDGLLMIRNNAERRVNLRAVSDPSEPGVADFILIFVKYPHTRQAIRDARPMIGPHTGVLTLQNGIGNAEILQEEIPDEQILFGLTTLTSELLGPGHIEESFQGQGTTYFWPLTGEVDARAERICAAFNQAGIHTEISSDVELRIWKKLIVNACQNTLSAITRLKVGDRFDQEETRPIFEGVISEIVQVARKKGIPLDEEEARRYNKQVGEEAREHVPSMLVDVKNKRRTEIDCLNGTVIREGERLGVSTPFNRTIYGLIRVIENTYNKRIG